MPRTLTYQHASSCFAAGAQFCGACVVRGAVRAVDGLRLQALRPDSTAVTAQPRELRRLQANQRKAARAGAGMHSARASSVGSSSGGGSIDGGLHARRRPEAAGSACAKLTPWRIGHAEQRLQRDLPRLTCP